jgi:membrane glycosyltransferase
MTIHPRLSFFERLFGAGGPNVWGQRVAWETQRAAWKAQRHAQRAAWKTQRDAKRAAWRADHWHARGPFAMVWGLMWSVFWIGIALLLVISPEFRSSVLSFLLSIPKFVVQVLHALLGRAEI